MSTNFVSIKTEPELSASNTEVIRYATFVKRLLKPQTEHLKALHIAIGICEEAGELAGAIKKEYVYNKPRDMTHIIEELGDLEFYVQALYNHYNLNRQDVLQANAEKLQVRYAKKYYSDEDANSRADKEGS